MPKQQTNVSVYLASSSKDPKIALLNLVCKVLGKTNSKLFHDLYVDYLFREGLIDKNGLPVKSKIKELEEKLNSKKMPSLLLLKDKE